MRPTQQVPTNWIWATLGDVLTGIEAGKSFKCDERPPTNGEVGVVKVSAVTWGTFDEHASKTCTEPERIDERFFIGPGDFLFSRANTIQLVGACVIVGGLSRRLMLSDKILRFRLKNVVPEWALYVLRSEWGRSEIERLATGNQESMRNIGQDRIRAIRIPLPPEVEQRRIVAEIETQLTRLDAAVAALRRASANLRRYGASVLEAGIAGNLVAGTPRAAWKVLGLGEISEIQGGIQKQPSRRPASNSFSFLRVANVLRGALDLNEIHRIELFPGELDRLRLQEGDLLIVEGNGSPTEIGRMAIWDGSIPDCVHQNHIIRARLCDTAIPEYVAAYWNSPTGSASVMAASSSTSGLHTLSVRKVSQIPVPLPPVDDQRAICDEINVRFRGIAATRGAVVKALRRAGCLRQSILKRAFEGRLVPQDPNDKPTEILIQRAVGDGQSNRRKRAAVKGK